MKKKTHALSYEILPRSILETSVWWWSYMEISNTWSSNILGFLYCFVRFREGIILSLNTKLSWKLLPSEIGPSWGKPRGCQKLRCWERPSNKGRQLPTTPWGNAQNLWESQAMWDSQCWCSAPFDASFPSESLHPWKRNPSSSKSSFSGSSC